MRSMIGARHRVQLHKVELGGGELARLVEDLVGHGDLADVVQERPGVQRLALLVREAEQAGHALGVNLDALHVLVRDLVFGIDGGGEGFERAHVEGARVFNMFARGLDVLEVGAVGEVVRQQHRDGEADGAEAVVVDHRVDDRRRQHAREVGDEDPRVALAPHADALQADAPHVGARALVRFITYFSGVLTAGVVNALIHYYGFAAAGFTIPVLLANYLAYRPYLKNIEDARRHVEQTRALHMRTLEALAIAIDAKDEVTHDHVRRVQIYSTGSRACSACSTERSKPCGRARSCTTSASSPCPTTS